MDYLGHVVGSVSSECLLSMHIYLCITIIPTWPGVETSGQSEKRLAFLLSNSDEFEDTR